MSAAALARCDLCGSTESVAAAPAGPNRCRTVVCAACGLIYAWPRLSAEALDELYRTEFDGDAGANARASAGVAQQKVRVQEEMAAQWALRIVERFVRLEGRRVLDLRCQTGALAQAMAARGADVFGVDPFVANVEFARRVRKLPHVALVPFSHFDIPFGGPFDAVTALSEHLLSHTPSPRFVLESIVERLRPGGYLFLDEKDALRLSRHSEIFALDTGPAHQYYLTVETTARYLQTAGLEIVECAIDGRRVSENEHIVAVARRPEPGAAMTLAPQARIETPPADKVLRRIRWSARTRHLRRLRRALPRAMRSLAGGVADRVLGADRVVRLKRALRGPHGS